MGHESNTDITELATYISSTCDEFDIELFDEKPQAYKYESTLLLLVRYKADGELYWTDAGDMLLKAPGPGLPPTNALGDSLIGCFVDIED